MCVDLVLACGHLPSLPSLPSLTLCPQILPHILWADGRQGVQPLNLNQAHEAYTAALELDHQGPLAVCKGLSRDRIHHVGQQPWEVCACRGRMQGAHAVCMQGAGEEQDGGVH